jgi:hypothetical protein
VRAPVHAGGFVFGLSPNSSHVRGDLVDAIRAAQELSGFLDRASTFRFNAFMTPMARKHRRAAERHDQDHRLHRGLPLRGLVDGVRKLRDVIAGVRPALGFVLTGKKSADYKLRNE